jgi:sn-glycerol 3-phosphate transport system permease protein
MERRTIFPGWALPMLLVAPQFILTLVLFYFPAAQAIWSSFTNTDPFGNSTEFVGLDNFQDLFTDPLYVGSILRTLIFCVCVTLLSMLVALILALFADREIRGRAIYRVLLIWPYAIAPSVAAVLWILLLHPQIGPVGIWLNQHGIPWDYKLNDNQAFFSVVLASSWKQISYNFIFMLAGLQSIPKAVIEAALLDGASGWRRLRTIVLPLLQPTMIFLLIVNFVYAAFDTFPTIMAMTQGGPGKATETLVVKVYRDGYINQDIGGSSAESVVLMLGVIVLVALQFRFLGKRSAE